MRRRPFNPNTLIPDIEADTNCFFTDRMRPMIRVSSKTIFHKMTTQTPEAAEHGENGSEHGTISYERTQQFNVETYPKQNSESPP